MVFTWHFIHSANGYPVSFEMTPTLFPMALLDEGHTGVALFMTLSGYLFAKLLDGKRVDFKAFLWNRALRLLPLLVLVLLMVGLRHAFNGGDVMQYLADILNGIVKPTLPNGGWSITVEFHFYLVLPVLLWLSSKSRGLPLGLIVVAMLLRLGLYQANGEIQTLSYWTILGRIDQFVLGMLAFNFREYIAGRHWRMFGIMLLFSAIYACFDLRGGLLPLPGLSFTQQAMDYSAEHRRFCLRCIDCLVRDFL
jgi:peptidoglycan/LPS O-acetylase OafA/YrhL